MDHYSLTNRTTAIAIISSATLFAVCIAWYHMTRKRDGSDSQRESTQSREEMAKSIQSIDAQIETCKDMKSHDGDKQKMSPSPRKSHVLGIFTDLTKDRGFLSYTSNIACHLDDISLIVINEQEITAFTKDSDSILRCIIVDPIVEKVPQYLIKFASDHNIPIVMSKSSISATRDRVSARNLLHSLRVDIPTYTFFSWDSLQPGDDLVEGDEFIEVRGVRLDKPFIEKPIECSADQECLLYLPSSYGGGAVKISPKDQKAVHLPNHHNIRKDRPYIYEAFLPSAKSSYSVKVYGVASFSEKRDSVFKFSLETSGGDQSHQVHNRHHEDERHLYTKLFKALKTPFEVHICRHGDTLYVLDILEDGSETGLKEQARSLLNTALENISITTEISFPLVPEMPLTVQTQDADKEVGDMKEISTIPNRLRIVIARHGQRTPKRKIKFLIKHPLLLNYYRQRTNLSGVELRTSDLSDLQMITKVLNAILRNETVKQDPPIYLGEIQKVVDILRDLIGKDYPWRQSIIQTCKLQLRPEITQAYTNDETIHSIDGLTFIFKWGGTLSHIGLRQMQNLGQQFRSSKPSRYKGASFGTAQEPRIKCSAAAFADGYLQLGIPLPHILLFHVDQTSLMNSLLDDTQIASNIIRDSKKQLKAFLSTKKSIDTSLKRLGVPTRAKSLLDALDAIKNPHQFMSQLHKRLSDFVQALEALSKDASIESYAPLSDGETFDELSSRWNFLSRNFYIEANNTFDISVIPDIYNYAKYDCLHNPTVLSKEMDAIMQQSRTLNNFIGPQEYGVLRSEKLGIAQLIASPLVWRISELLQIFSVSQDPVVSSAIAQPTDNFFFTSEAHMHALVNLLRYGDNSFLGNLLDSEAQNKVSALQELDYGCHLIIEAYSSEQTTVNTNAGECFVDAYLASAATGEQSNIHSAAQPEPLCLFRRKPLGVVIETLQVLSSPNQPRSVRSPSIY